MGRVINQLLGDSPVPETTLEVNDDNREIIIKGIARSLLEGGNTEGGQRQYIVDRHGNIVMQQLGYHAKELANRKKQNERDLRTKEKNQTMEGMTDSIHSGEGAISDPVKEIQLGLGNYPINTRDETFIHDFRKQHKIVYGLESDANEKYETNKTQGRINYQPNREQGHEISYDGDIYTRTTLKNGNMAFLNKDGENINPLVRVIKQLKDSPELTQDLINQNPSLVKQLHNRYPDLIKIADMDALNDANENYSATYGARDIAGTIKEGKFLNLIGDAAVLGVGGFGVGLGLKVAGKKLSKESLVRLGKIINDTTNAGAKGNKAISAAGMIGAWNMHDDKDITGDQLTNIIAGGFAGSTGLVTARHATKILLDSVSKGMIKADVAGKTAFRGIYNTIVPKGVRKMVGRAFPEQGVDGRQLAIIPEHGVTDIQFEEATDYLTTIINDPKLTNQEKKEMFASFASSYYASGIGGVNSKRTRGMNNLLIKSLKTIEANLKKELDRTTLEGMTTFFRTNKDEAIKDIFRRSANQTGLPQFFEEFGSERIPVSLERLHTLKKYVLSDDTRFLFREYAPVFRKQIKEAEKAIAEYKSAVAQAKGLTDDQLDQIEIPKELSEIDIPLNELNKMKGELGSELDKEKSTIPNWDSYNKEKSNISGIIKDFVEDTLGEGISKRYTKALEEWSGHKTRTKPVREILHFLNKNNMRHPVNRVAFQALLENIWQGKSGAASTLGRTAIDSIDDKSQTYFNQQVIAKNEALEAISPEAQEAALEALQKLQEHQAFPGLRGLIAESIVGGNKIEGSIISQLMHQPSGKVTPAQTALFDGLELDIQREWVAKNILQSQKMAVSYDSKGFSIERFNEIFTNLDTTGKGALVDKAFGKGYTKRLVKLGELGRLTKDATSTVASRFAQADNKGLFKTVFDFFDKYGISIDGLSNNLLHMAYRRVGAQWLGIRYGTRLLKTMSNNDEFKKSFEATMVEVSDVLEAYLERKALSGGIPKDIGAQIGNPQSPFWKEAIENAKVEDAIAAAAKSNGFVFGVTGGSTQTATIKELTKDDDDKQ